MNVFHTYIIPQGLITQALAKCKDVEGLFGLNGMFITPLSPSGTLPATHYVSSGWFSQEELIYLDSQLPRVFEESNGTFNGQPENVFEMFSRLGLKMVQV